MELEKIPETTQQIIERYATINERTNYAALGRRLGCTRSTIYYWKKGQGPDRGMLMNWYANGNGYQRIFSWEILKSKGVELPKPGNGSQPEMQG